MKIFICMLCRDVDTSMYHHETLNNIELIIDFHVGPFGFWASYKVYEIQN